MSAPRASSGSGIGSRWTRAEDTALLRAVEARGHEDWDAVIREPGLAKRTAEQCRRRYESVLSAGLVKGPWMPHEDQIILDCVARGITRWSEIAEHIPGRIGKQCRERWQNHLCPDLNRGPFSAEEDAVLEAAVLELGTKWIEVARRLPGRSENACKNRYNSSRRRRANAEARVTGGGAGVSPGRGGGRRRRAAAPASAPASADENEDEELEDGEYDDGDEEEQDGEYEVDGDEAGGDHMKPAGARSGSASLTATPARGASGAGRGGEGVAATAPSTDARRNRRDAGEAVTSAAAAFRSRSLQSTPAGRARLSGSGALLGLGSAPAGLAGAAPNAGGSTGAGAAPGFSGRLFRKSMSRVASAEALNTVPRVGRGGRRDEADDAMAAHPGAARRLGRWEASSGVSSARSEGSTGYGWDNGSLRRRREEEGSGGGGEQSESGDMSLLGASAGSSASSAAAMAAAVLLSTSGGLSQPAASPTSAAAGTGAYTYDIDLGAINDDLETMEDEDGHVHDMLQGSVRVGRGMGAGGASLLALRPGMADGLRSAGFVQAGSLRRHESMDETMAVVMEAATDWNQLGRGASAASGAGGRALPASAAAEGPESAASSAVVSPRQLLMLDVEAAMKADKGGEGGIPSPLPSLDRVYAATLLSGSSGSGASGAGTTDPEVTATAEAFAVSRVSPAKRRHEELPSQQQQQAEADAAASPAEGAAIASPAPPSKRPRLSSPSLLNAAGNEVNAATAALMMTPAPAGLSASTEGSAGRPHSHVAARKAHAVAPPGATAGRDPHRHDRADDEAAAAAVSSLGAATQPRSGSSLPGGGSAPGTMLRGWGAGAGGAPASLASLFSPDPQQAASRSAGPKVTRDSQPGYSKEEEDEEEEDDAGGVCSDDELAGAPGASGVPAPVGAASSSRCGSASSYRARAAALAAAGATGSHGGRLTGCGATSAHLEYPSYPAEPEEQLPKLVVMPPVCINIASVGGLEDDGSGWPRGGNDAAAVPSVLPSPIPLPASAVPPPTSVQVGSSTSGSGMTFAFRIAPASPSVGGMGASALPSPRAPVASSAFTPATPVFSHSGAAAASKAAAAAPHLSLRAMEGPPPGAGADSSAGPHRARSASTGSVSSVLLKLATGPAQEVLQ